MMAILKNNVTNIFRMHIGTKDSTVGTPTAYIVTVQFHE